jgi:hypothetical protein
MWHEAQSMHTGIALDPYLLELRTRLLKPVDLMLA